MPETRPVSASSQIPHMHRVDAGHETKSDGMLGPGMGIGSPDSPAPGTCTALACPTLLATRAVQQSTDPVQHGSPAIECERFAYLFNHACAQMHSSNGEERLHAACMLACSMSTGHPRSSVMPACPQSWLTIAGKTSGRLGKGCADHTTARIDGPTHSAFTQSQCGPHCRMLCRTMQGPPCDGWPSRPCWHGR